MKIGHRNEIMLVILGSAKMKRKKNVSLLNSMFIFLRSMTNLRKKR